MLTAPLKYLNMAKNLMNIIKNVTLTIAMLNSVINPFMYCWLRQDFKCAFRELLGNYRKPSVQLYSSILYIWTITTEYSGEDEQRSKYLKKWGEKNGNLES